MEKDLRIEYGMDEESDDDEDDEEIGSDNESDLIEEVENETVIKELRKEVEQSVSLADVPEDKTDHQSDKTDETVLNNANENEDEHNPVNSEDDETLDDLGNLRDFNSKFKPFRDNQDDTASIRSFSTSASTIAPSVIKARVKASLDKKGRKGQARIRVAKGEASAKTRARRNNRDNISTSRDAFWGND